MPSFWDALYISSVHTTKYQETGLHYPMLRHLAQGHYSRVMEPGVNPVAPQIVTWNSLRLTECVLRFTAPTTHVMYTSYVDLACAGCYIDLTA